MRSHTFKSLEGEFTLINLKFASKGKTRERTLVTYQLNRLRGERGIRTQGLKVEYNERVRVAASDQGAQGQGASKRTRLGSKPRSACHPTNIY